MRRFFLVAAFALLALGGPATPAPAHDRLALADYGEGNAYVIHEYGSHRTAVIRKGMPIPFGWYVTAEIIWTPRRDAPASSSGYLRLR